ncbi:MAG TPA: ATP-dependent protease ATPase subunit HslU, partial [Candidatus Onthoplasma faecigallinarum]|nr:ATP-dependent protease ATPase subunit HslU [Candidatus Onthoplasma faecigallinarum]
TCKEIVKNLDMYIVGQSKAKRAVAIALRNRYRRSKLPKELSDEITPKNIILKGPTGVGKTEIARRLAKLVNAPFVKVEATKYTEVGYVGRDVESMIRDLVEASVRIVRQEYTEKIKDKASVVVDKKITDILYPLKKANKPEDVDTEKFRQNFYEEYKKCLYDKDVIDIDVKEQPKQINLLDGGGGEINIGQIMGGMFKGPRKIKKMTVERAKEILLEEECEKMIDPDMLNKEAIYRAEQEGIIFIDEIDKIAAKKNNGQDVSREGVQRDILPIVEGSVVNTKYGVVHTDYILFIAAGAFHISSVSDLIPELQGRFPIQVELDSLDKGDFKKILTIPQNAITTQYEQLLKVDNIDLEFTEDAIDAIAELAADENETNENIGARRLQTIMEMLLEDISFNASDENPVVKVKVDKQFVLSTMKDLIHTHDFKKYVL